MGNKLTVMNKNASFPLRIAAIISLAVLISVPQAHAVSKEIIELQTQIQALQDSLQQMQRANADRKSVV